LPVSTGGKASLVARIGPSELAFGTDGSTLQQAGLPVVMCGPGSMEQGHQPDEFLEISELERCDAFMRELAAWSSRT